MAGINLSSPELGNNLPCGLPPQVLQADWLREMANQMAYYDKPRLATVEARRIGKLHTYLPGKGALRLPWE